MKTPRWLQAWLVLLAFGLPPFGCDGDPSDDVGTPRILAAHLVPPNSYAMSFSGDGAFLVEVYTSHGVDSIPGIKTERVPAVRNDSILTGLVVRDGVAESAFRYSIRSRSLEELALPHRGFEPAASSPAISPTGRYIAYVQLDSTGLMRLRVDRWPAGEPLMRGPLLRARCSRQPRNQVRWLDEDTLEALIDRCVSRDQWVRLHGSVMARRLTSSLYADTARTSPW